MKKDENKLILAWKLMDCGQYEEALAIYLFLPWNEEKYNGMARALTEMDRFEETERVLNAPEYAVGINTSTITQDSSPIHNGFGSYSFGVFSPLR